MLLMLLSLVSSAVASADFIVAPNANATVEGNALSVVPFSPGARTFQWILSSSQFVEMLPGSQITAIGLRLDVSQQSQLPSDISFDRWDLQISSARNGVGALSATFADNIGTDAVLVRSGQLDLPASSFSIGSSPNRFAPIAFTTPYLYGGGDLLLTLSHSNSAISFPVPIDCNAVDAFGQAIIGTVGPTAVQLSANYPITQFEFTAVPEPSCTALLTVAVALFCTARRSRRARGLQS